MRAKTSRKGHCQENTGMLKWDHSGGRWYATAKQGEYTLFFKEISVPSTKGMFISEIENTILSGELKAGDRLPTEREIAEQMNVPRSVVNAGLSDLERKGFVQVVPRRGTMVTDYMRFGNLETLTAIRDFNGGYFDRRTFESIMDFRMLCEPHCAYLAALNRREENLREMEELCERRAAAPNIREAVHIRYCFEKAMYYATNNSIYPLIYNSFEAVSQSFAETAFKAMGESQTGIGMSELLEAIRAQDAERAREIKADTDATIIGVLRENYVFQE